jgi:hypothetical protein
MTPNTDNQQGYVTYVNVGTLWEPQYLPVRMWTSGSTA